MAVADRELVEQTLTGDLEGFAELHRRYYHRVVHVITGIVRNRIQSEDIVQEAYVTALRDLPRLKDPERFYPWVCRIAVNQAIDEKRRQRRRDQWLARPNAVTPEAADSETSLLRAEEAEAVRIALERLPEGQRAAVTLRFFDDLPMRTIAETLGCGETTARSQVFRGLRKLGVFLKARKGGSR